MEFVTDVLFESVCSPDSYRERYYCEQCKIITLITYFENETRISKIDQEKCSAFCIVM